MRPNPALLIIYVQLLVLTQVFGEKINTIDLSTKNFDFDRHVNLEFNKDYTSADLEALFMRQVKGDTVESGSVSVADFKVKASSDDLSQGAWNRPVNMENEYAWYYRQLCPIVRRETAFSVKVTFDGNHAHFFRGQNIDEIPHVTISGGYKKPFVSFAEFHHSFCIALSPTTLCSYYIWGEIRATITVLGMRRLEIEETESTDPSFKHRPYATEQCREVPSTKTARCPTPLTERTQACDYWDSSSL